MKLGLFIFALVGFSIPSLTFACESLVGWEKPNPDAPAITLTDAIKNAQTENQIKIEKSEYQPTCASETYYVVTDVATNTDLVGVPVPTAEETSNDGRTLSIRVAQLLKTPREQLVALSGANKVFVEDKNGTQEDLGVTGFFPTAIPLESRIKNNAQDLQVYVFTQNVCDAESIKSPGLFFKDLYMKTTGYIPGRTDYSPETVYQKGDFKKAFLQNEAALNEYKKSVATNAEKCADDTYGKRAKWVEINERVTSNNFANAPELFKAITSEPQSAFMYNANRIVVSYPEGEKQFAGTVDEMIEIQNALLSKNISTDKTDHLDFDGKLANEIITQKNWSAPASLTPTETLNEPIDKIQDENGAYLILFNHHQAFYKLSKTTSPEVLSYLNARVDSKLPVRAEVDPITTEIRYIGNP